MQTLVLDCRWLGLAGAGRATELLLRGLAGGRRQADWLLWGPAVASQLAPGFELVRDDADPRRWFGQLGLMRIPRRNGGIVFMHQTRPVISPRCVTVVHDTTQLRAPASRLVRQARRAFLRRVARSSAGVITVSEWSRARIAADLGVAEDRIRVVGNPADPALGERIRALRETTERREMALFVGSFAPHKNLPRLVSAFSRTDLFAGGGELVLAGGRPEEAARMRAALAVPRVRVVERCPQDDLDALYASARIVVQPSLEEGFGLPVWEAMAAGIPVCSSTGGALAAVGARSVRTFDPTSVAEIAAAIDATVREGRLRDLPAERGAAHAFLAASPTPVEYALGIERAALDLLGAAA